MNQSRTHQLRALFEADPIFPLDDPRSKTIWRRFKRCLNRVPRNQRGPDQLQSALAKAMLAMAPSK